MTKRFTRRDLFRLGLGAAAMSAFPASAQETLRDLEYEIKQQIDITYNLIRFDPYSSTIHGTINECDRFRSVANAIASYIKKDKDYILVLEGNIIGLDNQKYPDPEKKVMGFPFSKNDTKPTADEIYDLLHNVTDEMAKEWASELGTNLKFLEALRGKIFNFPGSCHFS